MLDLRVLKALRKDLVLLLVAPIFADFKNSTVVQFCGRTKILHGDKYSIYPIRLLQNRRYALKSAALALHEV